MDNQGAQYVSVKNFKKAFGITNDISNKQLPFIISEANVEIDIRLKSCISKYPIDTKSTTYLHAGIIALRLAKAIWFENQNQLEISRYCREIYELQMKYLIEAIKADNRQSK